MAWMEFEKVESYERPLSKKCEQELLLRIDRGEKLSEGDLLRLVQCNCIEEATLDIDRLTSTHRKPCGVVISYIVTQSE